MNISIKKSKKNPLLKVVLCAALSLSCTLQPIAFALPSPNVSGGIKFVPVQISSRLGKVDAAYIGKHNKPRLVLIQDAHTNTSAQLNIAGIIEDLLNNHSISTVFLEAGSGDLSLNELKVLGSAQQRQEVALRFLKKGMLQGSEYLQLTSNLNFDLFGVEEDRLYNASLNAFKLSIKYRPLFKERYQRAKLLTLELADKILDPRLISFLNFQDQNNKGEVGPVKYAVQLFDWMQLIGETDTASNGLLEFISIKDLEEKIDFKSVLSELHLWKNGPKEQNNFFLRRLIQVLESGDHELLIDFLQEGIESGSLNKLNFPKSLELYERYLNQIARSDFAKLWEGVERSERMYVRKLISSEVERRLYLAIRQLEAFKNLSEQKLTPQEALLIVGSTQKWQQLTGFLNTLAAEHHIDSKFALLHEPKEDEWVSAFENFYDLTLRRDQKFLDNISGYMQKNGLTEGVLIAGGYHTANLKQLLQTRGWSYTIITPLVEHETDLSRYEKLLVNQPDEIFATSSEQTQASQNPSTMMLRQVQSNRGPLRPSVLRQAIQEGIQESSGDEVRVRESLMTRFRRLITEQAVRLNLVESKSTLPKDVFQSLSGSRLALSVRQPKQLRLTNLRTRDDVLVREHPATIKFGNFATDRALSSFQIEIIYDQEKGRHFFTVSTLGGSIKTDEIEFSNKPIVVQAKAGKQLRVREKGVFRKNLVTDQYIPSRDIDFTIKKIQGTDFQFRIENNIVDAAAPPLDFEEAHVLIFGIEAMLFDEFLHYERVVSLLQRALEEGLSDRQIIEAFDQLNQGLAPDYNPLITLALNQPFSHTDDLEIDGMSGDEIAAMIVNARDSDETIQDLQTLFYRMARYVGNPYEGGWGRPVNPNLAMFPVIVGLIHSSPRLRATAMEFFSAYQVTDQQRNSLIRILSHELRSQNSPDYVRQAAIRALQHFDGDEQILEALEQELRYDPNSQNEDLVPTDFLISALRTLTVYNDPGSVIIAAAFMGSDNERVREIALNAYTTIADTSIESQTVRRNNSVNERLDAINRLLNRPSSRLRDETIVYALSDSSSLVAERAVDAIVSDPAFPIEPIIRSIQHPDLSEEEVGFRNPNGTRTFEDVTQDSRLRAVQALSLKGVGEELPSDFLSFLDQQAAEWDASNTVFIEEYLTNIYPLGSAENLSLLEALMTVNQVVEQELTYGMTDAILARFRVANDLFVSMVEVRSEQLPNLSNLLETLQSDGARLSDNPSDADKALKDIVKKFDISDVALQELSQNAINEMNAGLRGENSSLKMIRSDVRQPTGKEFGEVLAYDFGGTNARALKVQLRGNGILNEEDIHIQEQAIPEYLKTASVDELYDFFAQQIQTLGLNPDQSYHLGFSFAFPVDANGNLIYWNKEFNIPELVGKNVVQPLYEALERIGIRNVTIVGPANDTVTTLAASGYGSTAASLGVIAGTGHNIAAWVNGTAVNFESGGFSVFETPSMNVETDIDRAIDAKSEKPGNNRLEKMMSGKYFGEVVRLTMAELVEEKLLFDGVLPEGLIESWSLETQDASVVFASDESADLNQIRSFLISKGVPSPTLQDAQRVKDVTILLARRSAKLLAAMIAAGIQLNDPLISQKHFVAVDGSLYEKFPLYQQYLNEGLSGILGESNALNIVTFLQADASGVGAALIAASAKASLDPNQQIQSDVDFDSGAPSGARLAKSVDETFQEALQEANNQYHQALLQRLGIMLAEPITLLNGMDSPTIEQVRQIFEAFEENIYDAVAEVHALRVQLALLEGDESGFLNLRSAATPDCGICHGVSWSLWRAMTHMNMDVSTPIVDLGPGFASHRYVRWGDLAIDLALGQFDSGYTRKVIVHESADEYDRWVRQKIIEDNQQRVSRISVEQIEETRLEYLNLRAQVLRAIRDSHRAEESERSRLAGVESAIVSPGKLQAIKDYAVRISEFHRGKVQLRVELTPYQSRLLTFDRQNNRGLFRLSGVDLTQQIDDEKISSSTEQSVSNISDWLDAQTKIRSLMDARIEMSQENEVLSRPYLAVINLDGLVGNDAITQQRIQALAASLSRLSSGRKILLIGPDVLIREMVRTVSSGPIVFGSEKQLSVEDANLPRTYLMSRGALEHFEFKTSQNRLIAIEDIESGEQETAVHAYQPIVRWMDALGSFDQERADAVSRDGMIRFYRQISNGEFTGEDLNKIIQGDRVTALRFAIPAVSRLALNLAVRAYQLMSRTVGISA